MKIAKRPDTIVGFGETRIHAETATFEVQAREVASPRPDHQLTVDGETFVVQASRSGAIPNGRCGGAWTREQRELIGLDDRPNARPLRRRFPARVAAA
jgi:hypothetical protein